MKVAFTFLLVYFFFVHVHAQEGEPVIVKPPPSTNELLKECTKGEQVILQEQLSGKDVFEKNTKSTQEIFKSKLERLEQYAIIGDESREGMAEAGGISQDRSLFRVATIIADSWDEAETRERTLRGPSQYDSRVELNELSPLIDWQREILNNGRSVGIVVHRERLSDLTDSIYALDISTKLKTVFQLCPEEPYGDQLSLGVGTAFITGLDTMMTAGHVFEGNISDYVVLFNYEIINREGAIFPIVAQRNVYEIEKIIDENSDFDITSFTVSKPLPAPPLKLATSNQVKRGESIYMIGHPSGLPKKVALNASVYTDDEPFHFYSTLDAFQGNSGSPVFDLETHTVIGVLVSGLQDYQWTGNCNKSNLCFIPYCKGEKVMRMEQILND